MSRKGAAAGGFAFVTVDVAALLIGGPLPSVDAPAPVLTAFYASNADRLLAQAYVRGVAMGLLLVFAGSLRQAQTSVPTGVFVAALRAVAAVELVRVALVAALSMRVPVDPAPWHAVGLTLGAVIAFPLAAGTMEAATWRDEPRWWRVAAWVLAALWLATGVRTAVPWAWLWTAGTAVTIAWGGWLTSLLWRLRIAAGRDVNAT